MRHLAEAYECRLLSFHSVSSFICLDNILLFISPPDFFGDAELKRYHLTFSGAGTAHNLYCNVLYVHVKLSYRIVSYRNV